MLIPGVDFTTIGKVADAYFKCVNDNGGINGRPIKYTLYNEQLNPAQEAALARKLIESDKVVGIVGNTSFAECGTNWKYYKSQGLHRHRRRRPGGVLQHAVLRRVEHGPALQRRRRRPGTDPGRRQEDRDRLARHDLGVRRRRRRQARRSRSGIPVKVFPTHLPVTDATSQLLQMYQFAGDGGGIILDFTPDTAPAFMKAAEAQGIVDKVQVGLVDPDREHVHGRPVLAEVRRPPLDQPASSATSTRSSGRTRALMFADPEEVRAEASRRRRSARWASWTAKFATNALLSIKGPVTAKSYNAAVTQPEERQDGHALQAVVRRERSPYHIPNNTDITVDYKNGKVVVKEKCFDIAPVDTAIAQTRVWEKKYNLNTGK